MRAFAFIGAVVASLAASEPAAARFGDGFASADLAAYLDNPAKNGTLALVRADGMRGKRALRLKDKAQATFKMVPVDEDTKYTLTLRARFDGGEALEDNPRFDTFVTDGSKPPMLPHREIEFYDASRKRVRGRGSFASAMPLRAWQSYRDTFYPPMRAAFAKLIIRTPRAGLTCYVDDVKLEKTPDEGAINCNPVQGRYGLYDYSGWRRPASGGKIVRLDDGKIVFDTKYGTGGMTFPLSRGGTYALSAKRTGNGYNSVVIVHFLNGGLKKVGEVALRGSGPRYFLLPDGVKRGAFLVYSNLLEEVRLNRIGDEKKINEVRAK